MDQPQKVNRMNTLTVQWGIPAELHVLVFTMPVRRSFVAEAASAHQIHWPDSIASVAVSEPDEIARQPELGPVVPSMHK